MFRRFDTQGFSASIQLFFTASIAEEPIVPYADEAGWNDVQHEPPDKFHAIEFHAFLPVVVAIVFPSERDAFLVHGNKAIIAYCHPVPKAA
jgi:hypothetical protein